MEGDFQDPESRFHSPSPPSNDSESRRKQAEVEKSVADLLSQPTELEDYILHRDKHVKFLLRAFEGPLSAAYKSYEPIQPWVVYWVVHALDLLHEENILVTYVSRIIAFLASCQNADGGFGGGPGQLSHLATTYAAIMTLVIIGTPEAHATIDRPALYAFLLRVKNADGSFCVHDEGEVDVRGSYCALAVAKVCNLLTPQLVQNAARFIASCQTHEGGLGACAFHEAHGAYTFCGVASLSILDQLQLLDIKKLTKWVQQRQMPIEGGFQGRVNKLVDACYSFWQPAALHTIHSHLTLSKNSQSSHSSSTQALPMLLDQDLYDRDALQAYILIAAQSSSPDGGIRDKPGVRPDFYHTCYALSGLSLAQHGREHDARQRVGVLGPKENLLHKVDPVFNIRPEHLEVAFAYFMSLPSMPP